MNLSKFYTWCYIILSLIELICDCGYFYWHSMLGMLLKTIDWSRFRAFARLKVNNLMLFIYGNVTASRSCWLLCIINMGFVVRIPCVFQLKDQFGSCLRSLTSLQFLSDFSCIWSCTVVVHVWTIIYSVITKISICYDIF